MEEVRGGVVVDGVGGWGWGGGGLSSTQTSWLQWPSLYGYRLLYLSGETGVNLSLRSLLCTLRDTHLKVNKWFMAEQMNHLSHLVGLCTGRKQPRGSCHCHALSCTAKKRDNLVKLNVKV